MSLSYNIVWIWNTWFLWGQIVFVCACSSILTLPSLCWWWKERMWTASTQPWPRSPTSTLASSPPQASDGYTSQPQYSEYTYCTFGRHIFNCYLGDQIHLKFHLYIHLQQLYYCSCESCDFYFLLTQIFCFCDQIKFRETEVHLQNNPVT